MQCREPAHRQADDVGLVDRQSIEHGPDIVARAILRIALDVVRHVGRGIAPRIVRDGAVAPPEIAQLRFP
jgi:hypothetical protein